jgi:hypothetical protein
MINYASCERAAVQIKTFQLEKFHVNKHLLIGVMFYVTSEFQVYTKYILYDMIKILVFPLQ